MSKEQKHIEIFEVVALLVPVLASKTKNAAAYRIWIIGAAFFMSNIQLTTILGSLIISKLNQKLTIQPNDFINDLHALTFGCQHGLHIFSVINNWCLQGTF